MSESETKKDLINIKCKVCNECITNNHMLHKITDTNVYINVQRVRVVKVQNWPHILLKNNV